MSPFHLLRRRITRHPLAWVLALALALVGAQTAGAVHALSHGLASSAAASVHASAEPGAKAHAVAGADCLTCLAAAALGGAAPAPVLAPLPVDVAAAPVVARVDTAWTPRVLRAYASRAPPSRTSA